MLPIMKWAGGKRNLLPALKNKMPQKFNRYFELFCGGGALFFALNKAGSVINDSNFELINLYTVIRDNPAEFVADLQKHQNNKEYFLELRALQLAPDCYDNYINSLSMIQRASRFFYLIKSCFRGLHRVNKSGRFNTPYGAYKAINLPTLEEILEHSKLLQKTIILNQDYQSILTEIQAGDFVYLDPPYVPISDSADFTRYTDNGFGETEQIELKDFCINLHNKGAYFMQSNSKTDYVNQLYSDFNIQTVINNRSISQTANGRGNQPEHLITNFTGEKL